MTKLEEVARALAPKAWATYGQIGMDTLANRRRRTTSLRLAREVVEAMRKPTDGSILADALDQVPGCWGRGAWAVGIDAILSEPQP